MIIKIYDRYTNETISLIKIEIDKETLQQILKEFKVYLNKALTSNEPLDADDEELYAFIENKGYDIETITIDEEIDL